MNVLGDSELIRIILKATDPGRAEQAWRVLLARHGGTVRAQVRGSFRSVSMDLIEEALAEAHLKVVASLHGLKKPARFRAFFRSIARNCVIDLLRHYRRWHGVEDEGELERSLGLPGGTGDALGSEEERALARIDVAAALHRLPPRQFQVLCLRHRDGYKYGEIAELLGVTVGGVGSVLVEARRNLARLLGVYNL